MHDRIKLWTKRHCRRQRCRRQRGLPLILGIGQFCIRHIISLERANGMDPARQRERERQLLPQPSPNRYISTCCLVATYLYTTSLHARFVLLSSGSITGTHTPTLIQQHEDDSSDDAAIDARNNEGQNAPFSKAVKDGWRFQHDWPSIHDWRHLTDLVIHIAFLTNPSLSGCCCCWEKVYHHHHHHHHEVLGFSLDIILLIGYCTYYSSLVFVRSQPSEQSSSAIHFCWYHYTYYYYNYFIAWISCCHQVGQQTSVAGKTGWE